ncbi:hypothetical protein TTHERM_00313070 (macronuclear) [Tetrahymena thermophila SB210]|uniref:Uncharacterized protein n=1 Tax=Tetrahymena thermophila (strain SB210) TaxID=312017 RepID=Q22KH4_TETTS|nr:hypothetical protein TTHERM_00313070 [Tetrahymena thermophila SB210]EAR85825.2 hypothetical protein TTHERM_00313070 [Tetrahymena thermophila SB210]|eukprot:XP_001033488.2 hypothetical protein TTHERM_00313070 [Tetrahymena thermophila SB210]
MLANQLQQNYENAKKCVQALKSISPMQMGNSRFVSQEQCLKLLRVLVIKELQDIAQQEKEDKQRSKDQDLFLGKRKSSQRQETKEDGEQEELEMIKIKKIKRNEINNSNLDISSLYEEKKEENNKLDQQFLAQHNNIQIQYFEQCFHSKLFGMIYSNFSRPSSDIAELFHSLTNVQDMFKHLKTIYKNQSIIINNKPKIFEECFNYVVLNIILKKEEFLNDIIKHYEELKDFIKETQIRTEQLYNLLSRVVQYEYRQDVQKFQDNDFSPVLKLFTEICSQLSNESKEDQASKEELKLAFKHYIKINHRTSLLKMAIGEYEKVIQGENLLKDAFNDKLYLLKTQTLDSSESDHISSFLVYMVFRIRPLFEDLFESFQQYSQNVQKQIMNILTRDQNKTKLKGFLQSKPNQQRTQQQAFLEILLKTFDYNNSYMLQVFIFDLLTRQDQQFIDQAESQKILEKLKSHVNQTHNIFDFYKSFPDYFDENIIQEYKNLKELQAPTFSQFKEKFSFLPEAKSQSTHLILFKRFLVEDSWFINKENMREFVNYFTEKVDHDQMLDFFLKIVTQDKQNLNVLIIPFLLKLQAIIDGQNEKQEKLIENIVIEMVQNKVWTLNSTFLHGLKIYFNNLCTPEKKSQLFAKINSFFSNLQNGKEALQQFEETFEQ